MTTTTAGITTATTTKEKTMQPTNQKDKQTNKQPNKQKNKQNKTKNTSSCNSHSQKNRFAKHTFLWPPKTIARRKPPIYIHKETYSSLPEWIMDHKPRPIASSKTLVGAPDVP